MSGTVIVVAKIKFSQVAMQMLRVAVLIDTGHAALEDREHAFDGGVYIANALGAVTKRGSDPQAKTITRPRT
jgi:drug/metabolite transporter superfamily protein YnfA